MAKRRFGSTHISMNRSRNSRSLQIIAYIRTRLDRIQKNWKCTDRNETAIAALETRKMERERFSSAYLPEGCGARSAAVRVPIVRFRSMIRWKWERKCAERKRRERERIGNGEEDGELSAREKEKWREEKSGWCCRVGSLKLCLLFASYNQLILNCDEMFGLDLEDLVWSIENNFFHSQIW